MDQDYTQLGYDKALNKQQDVVERYTDVDFDQKVDSISASKITQGVSQGTKLGLDYDNGLVTVKENNTTRVVTGKFLDGKFGMRVYDSSGVQVIDQTA